MSQDIQRQSYRILLLSGENPHQIRLCDELSEALTAIDVMVHRLCLSTEQETVLDELGTRLPEVRSLIDQAGTALGVEMPDDRSLQAIFNHAYSDLEGPFQAIACMDPHLAHVVFPLFRDKSPGAICVAIEPSLHPPAAWKKVDADDFIVAHPRLAEFLKSSTKSTARLRVGGPLTSLDEHPQKNLGDDLPLVVLSFAGLDASDIEPLLFQLSLSRPQSFSLLFLPTGRREIDDLLQQRAGRYGLTGKRPRIGAPVEGWIRGAALLLGRPTPHESAVAVCAQVPQLLIPTGPANVGDAFLIQQSLAAGGDSLHTLAMILESSLPGGDRHKTMLDGLMAFEVDGAAGVAQGILEALKQGPVNGKLASLSHAVKQGGQDELEDIGQSPVAQSAQHWSQRDPKIVLREIIIREKEVNRHLKRAESNLDAWNKRLDLASAAGHRELTEMATFRLRATEEIIKRLQRDRSEFLRLRQCFADMQPVSEMDWQAVEQMLSVQPMASFGTGDENATAQRFERLEVDDALAQLKARMKDSKES